MATCGDPSETWDLTCNELILETPPGPGQSPRSSWQDGVDEGSLSSEGGGIFEWASEHPNVDELWICERERIDGKLEERVMDLIERSERHRPVADYLTSGARTESGCSSSLDSCMSADTRMGLVQEMLDVCDRFELSTQTAALAVNYLDRTLSTDLVKRRNYGRDILKTVTLACLTIAIKLEEVMTVTPYALQMHLQPNDRVDTILVNVVEQMVLIQLEWHLLVPTAVDLLTPFICFLQAIPAWATATDCHPTVPLVWAEEHKHLWKKSCELLHVSLADAATLEFSAAELALGAVLGAVELCWLGAAESPHATWRLAALTEQIQTAFPHLPHAPARRCKRAMLRLADEASPEPPSPRSTLEAPCLGKRKAPDSPPDSEDEG
uniref:Cyclin-like domain-containing protein n=1 Tax=Pyramimonas obovata TaxID=1411642 RepID=A0A7S0WWI6_9CHLO|mmetsp:Transcript_7699/g.15676  ORF Transcript_7699/g.15676 Transcript_7699/m.15676 type:complete len:381 (+) Transcript_7699:182-1324(+)